MPQCQMEATAKSITTINWLHKPVDKFNGANTEVTNFALGLTPPDPQLPSCCYFNVQVTQTCTNSVNGIVFQGVTRTTFRVHNRAQRPSPEFLFNLLVEAGGDFARTYHERVAGTNLEQHQIAVPQFENWSKDILLCIDTWDSTLRNLSLN
jgi:hypothetical protein